MVMKVKLGSLYVEMEELKSKTMQALLAKHHGNRSFPIHCCCNPKALMHIRKNKDYYSLSTNPNRLKEHEPYCENSLNLSEHELQGKHYRVLEVINDGELKVNARHLAITISDEGSKKRLVNNPTSEGYSASSITLGSFGREWLSRAWEYAVMNYQKEQRYYPTHKVLQITLNTLFARKYPKIKVKIRKNLCLSDVLWIGQNKPQSFYFYNQKKIRPVVLCRLHKSSVQQDGTLMLFTVDGLAKEETYELSTTVDYWEAAINSCRVNYDNHEHFYIVGYGTTGDYGKPPMVERLELIPTTKRGMFVDSSYEAQLFEEFEAHRRIYKRLNQRMDELEGYSPDALLLDTEKVCIVEVFGMSETVQSYHETKDRKMQYYRTLEQYQTFYWHAYRNKTMPELPEKAL